MNRSRSARYTDPENGPIVFGCAAFDVRWNSLTKTVIVDDRQGGLWSPPPAFQQEVLLALAAAHRRGRLVEALREMLQATRIALSLTSEFYKCGKITCWKPTWQEAEK